MNPYRQSPDWPAIQREMRRADRRARFVGWWRRWGDGLLTGVLLGLAFWMIASSDPESPHPRGAVHAEVSK
ncbi:MAG: hypothetical protein F4060_02530 [Holophagales bacterium]|nr:hypothetical protein [Holophagales bacterium]MYA08549.1 hypothetical protein [Holophagales bacterium]MYB20846.1 hypothetical protein [Holophagales bacterium]MYD22009.1 hypothetical protein [Holophagales bacterium]MYG30105.1 hypothetical protein [Holophagales bacterium]